MHKRNVILLLVIVLVLAACGGAQQATPTPGPTDTPAPTATRAPTNTPQPTVDLASLSADDLWATVEALETEVAIEEQHLSAASGSDGASVQAKIDQLKRELAKVRELAEAAGARSEATAEATTEVTEEAANS